MGEKPAGVSWPSSCLETVGCIGVMLADIETFVFIRCSNLVRLKCLVYIPPHLDPPGAQCFPVLLLTTPRVQTLIHNK